MTLVPATVQVLAPAKINLALHVTGQRDDGYHLLDSFVSFTNIGDTLTVTAPGRGQMSVSGPFAADVPVDKSNLVFSIAEHVWPEAELSFHLHKELPIASGIGGGSADAAACYRALATLRQLGTRAPTERILTEERIAGLAVLGADIPMCVRSEPARVSGIGELIKPVQGLPVLPVVLVNPGEPVATPDVFKLLPSKENAGLPTIPFQPELDMLIHWLADQRNDLQQPACRLSGEIGAVLAALAATDGCSLARMSGSGATCFGLFARRDDARAAAKALSATHPAWWVRSAELNGPPRVSPYLMRSTT